MNILFYIQSVSLLNSRRFEAILATRNRYECENCIISAVTLLLEGLFNRIKILYLSLDDMKSDEHIILYSKCFFAQFPKV